ncbi:MAG: ABC transporter ATP-binding protein/permease [Spirochaetaceae bacterium]|jgi:ATP-binding cassette subfamily B protein|nr:ABC transporter ATP-binding protein/permease [Spirochaetaceae bacterium]
MAEYFEVEDVVKEYDGRIVKRIFGYVKPYRFLALFAALGLLISTAGELFIPVLTQRIIDSVIISRFIAIDTEGLKNGHLEDGQISAETVSLLAELETSSGAYTVGGMLLVPLGGSSNLGGGLLSQTAKLSADAEQELSAAGLVKEGNWYAFSFLPGEAAAEVVQRYPALFYTGVSAGAVPSGSIAAAIRSEDLYSLSLNEIRIIRFGDLKLLVYATVLFLIAIILVFGATFLQTWNTSLIGQRVMEDIRLALFKKTAGQSTDFLSRHPVGRIVTRLTGDVETINEFFTSVLTSFLKDFAIMIGVLITIFFLSPRLALVTLITMPPVAVIAAISRLKARDAFRRQRTASSGVNSYLSERLSGVQVVQLFGQEKRSGDEFSARNKELLSANLGEMYVFATFRPSIDFLANLTIALVVAVGSSLALHMSLSVGVLIAFITLVQMFFSPVQDIAEKYTLLQSAMAGGERVFRLLDTNEEIPDKGTIEVNGMLRGHITFDDVRFSYRKGEEILKGLSFTVSPGEMAAIVGYTGAGKTTIINVLTRLWDIDSGKVLLDGMPIENIKLSEVRRSILPVLQDVFLFSGTVADNIRLGLNLSDEEVEAAARSVHAHEFISRLPLGYKTMLAEGASNISSGQRQLISFARVIAHNPSIVILDEATSSIDTETEHLIQLGIQKVLSGRTSVVIAHRLSTIRNADKILVLSGGTLVESGNHKELIERDGLYAGLYKLQYSEKGEGSK